MRLGTGPAQYIDMSKKEQIEKALKIAHAIKARFPERSVDAEIKELEAMLAAA